MNKLAKIEPQGLWKNFEKINAIPRASKKEEKIIKMMLDFGKSLNLETFQDKIGNVIIKKPATNGMENRKTVVLQSHLDMVHQKNNDTVFDFETEGIKMYIDGDWVKAQGTTLGADNGIGVASIMTILESNDIVHPALEALFTIDEETGMTGAKELEKGILQGEILLNLDTEDDDEIDIGCAGGIDITATKNYKEEDVPENSLGYTINVKGLKGGHSGMDINLGLGNANKLMNRLFFNAFEKYGLQISSVNGGSLRNAIPRESVANVIIACIFKDIFEFEMQQIFQEIKLEFAHSEPGLYISITPSDLPQKVMDLGTQEGVIRMIYAAHNGVYRMTPAFEELVETSNNIAKIAINNGKISVQCLTRSSVESAKMDLAHSLQSCFELMGCEVDLSGSYPGWAPNNDSEILKLLVKIYEENFHEKPRVVACHAGLECGILGAIYPSFDMISFGPTIKGAHSPDERANIKSSQKFWKFLLQILKEIPSK
jgi:dipeptidase D